VNPILEVVLPVFGLILLGWSMARLKWTTDASVDGLTHFTYHFSVPLLLLRTLSRTALPDEIPWTLLVSFYGASFTVFPLSLWLSRRLLNKSFGEAAINGFTSAFPNTVLLGIPVVLMSFGEPATLPLFLIISLHSTLLFPLITLLMEIDRGGEASVPRILGNAAQGLARNPIILGLSCGMLLNVLEVTLPGPADRVAELMGQTVTPCALFALGATLTRFQMSGRWLEVGMVVSLKVLLQPLIVAVLAFGVFQLEDHLWASVAVLLAAQPAGANPYLFATRYNTNVALASNAVLVSTLVSVFTLSGVLWALH
jgi:malonate transporter